ncbi:glycosyltransferase family 4 protein [Kitasatospora atroaurantiaca]|uniref:D-inositol 3-phosphate glycosyltransferase n=1 Tax=Kitasatospora atroaurantiaca TaxID=285545 RepID=A0A561EQP2_9ACTN|nr:glycosyltransferase [Kitasatospora atroaurantiaca]TWE17938.1 glycosyltransferase involved in cell wall biosynthesis [Kitasatospora atroaurantiaca]
MSRDIFIVSNSVDELGGVASWSHRMAELFTARGHRVELIGIAPAVLHKDFGDDLPYGMTTLHTEHPPSAWTPRHPWQRLDARARRREAQRADGVRQAAERMSAMFRAAGPGAVVIVTQVWAMEWVAQADLKGLQVIGMSHESYETCRASSRFGRVKRYYAEADRLVVLTGEDADAWIREGMNSTCGIPNPLPFPVPSSVEPATKTVVSIGRLAQEKGYDLLLESWAEAVDRRPGWRLRIFGLGEEEAALRAQCTALGLDGSVEFAGRTDDVPGALAGASVFALPSRGEGFPISLMEAMACGVPCVAFDCAPGVREIIRDGEDGLLAPTGNTTALARQLGRLMDDQELQAAMGERARQAIARYSPERVTARWEELFALLEA